jgi:hypothetical protein
MDRTHRHQRKEARLRLGRLLPVLYRHRRSLPFGRDSVRPRTSQSPMSRHRPAVRRRVSTAVVVLAIGVAGVLSGPPAVAADPPDPTVPPTEAEDMDHAPVEQPDGPRPRVAWSVPDRFGDTPSIDYVHPTSWPVDFGGCASTGDGSSITTYTWNFGDGTPPQSRSSCTVQHAYAELGPYQVSLAINVADGRTATITTTVVVRDLLVVSLGDSAASGEGNPDEAAVGFVPPQWVNGSCHRSMQAGTARAARELEERDPHTSVTFLHLACSGAEIDAGVLDGSAGHPSLCQSLPDWLLIVAPEIAATRALLEPYCAVLPELDEPTFQPQVPALRNLICPDGCGAPGVRPVDHLMLSVGINDVRFSSIVQDCMKPWEDFCGDDMAAGFEQDLAALSAPPSEAGRAYDDLDKALDALPIEDIYITGYPYQLFTDVVAGDIEPEGCGVFDAVGDDEAEWLAARGFQLERSVHWAAVRHGWHYVENIPWAFASHGYCEDRGTDDDSWFVGFTESLLRQWHYVGVLHPNAAGHAEYARRILAEIDAEHASIENPRTAEVVVEAVRVFDAQRDLDDEITPRIPIRVSAQREGIEIEADWDLVAPETGFGPTTNGTWIELPSADFSFSVPVTAADELVLEAESIIGVELPRLDAVPQRQSSADDDDRTDPDDPDDPLEPREVWLTRRYSADHEWGRGSYEAEQSSQDDGYIELRYRIRLSPVVEIDRPELPDDTTSSAEDSTTSGPGESHAADLPDDTTSSAEDSTTSGPGESRATDLPDDAAASDQTAGGGPTAPDRPVVPAGSLEMTRTTRMQ